MYAYSHIDIAYTHTHTSYCSVSLEDMPPMLKALESSTIQKKKSLFNPVFSQFI